MKTSFNFNLGGVEFNNGRGEVFTLKEGTTCSGQCEMTVQELVELIKADSNTLGQLFQFIRQDLPEVFAKMSKTCVERKAESMKLRREDDHARQEFCREYNEKVDKKD